MTVATVDRPTPTTEMGRKEAESITQAIKNNFDSLGSMLIQARDRKAYKALGYRTFEGYCKTEFGKSSSNAYRLIEDAKVIAQLEAEISKRYDEPVTLDIPSACLRPLKELPDIDQKLRAIDYAKKLATAEGKKLATKKHLEIAVFEVSGKRSEDFKNAIQSLGFTKGVAVETTKTLEKNRGLVTRIDKLGKIHVQLYNGGVNSIAFDADELRILTDAEKPTRPLNEITVSKGDRVLIFAQGLEGKKGTIYAWKEGRQALVTVDGGSSPVDIAYAEMELIQDKQKEANWDSELVWESGKNTYYYFPQENKIYSNKWPTGLTLEPYTHSGSPIEFMENWETRFSSKVLESLATPARLKTLALAQAIELPENEGKEFAADLVASLSQLFPQPKPKDMGISFSRTIDELTSGKKTQTRRAWQSDYAKNFIRYFDENIAIPALNKGRHRGGHELGFIKLTQRPYQQYLSEMSLTDLQAEGGMVSTAQEFIDTYFEGQDKLVWVLHFEFLATPNTNNTGILIEESQRLREQLAEAESAIQEMVTVASATPPLDAAAPADFLVENTGSWREILQTNHFIPVAFNLDGMFKGNWRDWDYFFHSLNGGVVAIDLANNKKEMFTRCTEHNFDIDLGDEDEIRKWLKNIINQIEDFCPGQLSLDSDTAVDTAVDTVLDTALDTTEALGVQIVDVSANTALDTALDTAVDTAADTALDTALDTTEALGVQIVDASANTALDTALDTAVDTAVDTSLDIAEPQRETDYDDWSKWNASAVILDAKLKREIADWRSKTNEALAHTTKKLAGATRQPVKDLLKKEIGDSCNRLLELDAFEKIEIGQIVEKKICEGIHGKVTKLEFSPGGLPQIWVKWSDNKYPQPSNTFSLNLSPVTSLPSSDLDFSTQEDIRLLRESLLEWKAHAEEELAAAEEHNKTIFTRKIEARSTSLEQLQKFSKLRVGQYVVDRLSPRRGKVIAMHAKTERLVLEIEWECGKTELTPFKNIVPEQIK